MVRQVGAASWLPPGGVGLVRRSVRRCTNGGGWYATLWILLSSATALVVFVEAIPIAAPSPSLAASVATLAGVVGLVLLRLGVTRFLAFGRPLDLFVGLGFGVLALANLAVRLASLALLPDATWVAAPLLLLLLSALSAGLFLLPLARPDDAVEPERRAQTAKRAAGVTVVVALLGAVGLIAAGDALPSPVEPATRRLLEADVIVVDALPGQAWWLLLLNALLSALRVAATVGYFRRAGRSSESYRGAVTTALTLLSFAQLHTLLFPAVALDYVSTAALFRLAAYLVVVIGLTAQMERDMVTRVGHEERARLSRELHDGLMQHLSLLNLRLQRARSPHRPEPARARNLDASVRILEAAMLEARQVIIAQRADVVTWASFTESVSAFTGAFESNNEVLIDLHVGGTGPTVEVALQADVLRILHEACSNAVRHGAAGRIDVRLAVDADRLDLQVRDDGTGFAPDRARGGSKFGLQSMRERTARWGGTCSIESAAGSGTVVHARLSLSPRREMGT